MGTSEKRRRRAENRVFNEYTVLTGEGRLPLRESPSGKDLLREFAQPLARFVDDESARYLIAIFAWNASQFNEERRAELTEEFLGRIPGATAAGSRRMQGVIEALVERRIKLYPNELLAFIPRSEGS